MSMEDTVKFYEKIKENPSLLQRIGELGQGDQSKMEAAIIQVAGEHGFQFNLAELRDFLKEQAQKVEKSGELSDDQLATVAGGVNEKIVKWVMLSISSVGSICMISLLQKDVIEATCAIDK